MLNLGRQLNQFLRGVKIFNCNTPKGHSPILQVDAEYVEVSDVDDHKTTPEETSPNIIKSEDQISGRTVA